MRVIFLPGARYLMPFLSASPQPGSLGPSKSIIPTYLFQLDKPLSIHPWAGTQHDGWRKEPMGREGGHSGQDKKKSTFCTSYNFPGTPRGRMEIRADTNHTAYI